MTAQKPTASTTNSIAAELIVEAPVKQGRRTSAASRPLAVTRQGSQLEPQIDVFRKAVYIVHSSAYEPLTLNHRRLMNAWLKNAASSLPDKDGWWSMSGQALARECGMGNTRNYESMKQAARELMGIRFEYDLLAPMERRKTWKGAILFTAVEIETVNYEVRIRYMINPLLASEVTDPTVFALIDMHVIRQLKRASSIVILEHCTRFQNMGATNFVDWKLFKEMTLGSGPKAPTVSEYKYFKKDVLKPAINEINKVSPHTLILKEIKEGRRVTQIGFDLIPKASIQNEPSKIQNADELNIVGRMLNIGFKQGEAKKILRSHKQGEIVAALEYTEKRISSEKLDALESPSAYFRLALQNKYKEESQSAMQPDRKVILNKPKGQDIAELYSLHRHKEAAIIFNELDAAERESVIQRYNENQQARALKWGKKINPAIAAALHRWYAQEMWGTPTQDELLEFAQELITAQQRSLLSREAA